MTLGTFDGWWCTKCKTLCHVYEQGLCCACDQPWETEKYYEKDYPETWIKCEVEVRKAFVKHRIHTDFEYETERLNALIAVMAETSWTIKPHRLRHWRACVRTTGHLIGLEPLGELTLYATDGVLGLFRRHDTGRVDTYHTHRPSNQANKQQEKIFTGKIVPLVQKPKLKHHDTDAAGNPIARSGRVRRSDTIKQLLIEASQPRTIRDDIRDSL